MRVLTENLDEIQKLDILTMAIATDVIEKIPIGVSKLFLNDINKLFCFTAVGNPFNNNKIIHIWEYNGQTYLKSFIKVTVSILIFINIINQKVLNLAIKMKI